MMRGLTVHFLFLLLLPLVSAGTSDEGLKFLMYKETEEGVMKTDSGLLYKIITPGDESKHSPSFETLCEVHYAMQVLGDTSGEIVSSYERGVPLTVAPNQVIPGWGEAMQLMKEGSFWELYIPSELAYGDKGSRSGKIPPGAVLVVRLELLKVKLPEIIGMRGLRGLHT